MLIQIDIQKLKLSVIFLFGLFSVLSCTCPFAPVQAQALNSAGSAPNELGSSFERNRKPYIDTHPQAKSTLEAQEALQTGPGPIKDHAAPPFISETSRSFPAPAPVTTTIDGSKLGTIGMAHVKQGMGLTKSSQPEAPLTMSGVQSTMASLMEQDRQLRNDPDNARAPTQAAASALSNYAANNMAGAAVSQSQGAIEFTRHYLINFTAKAGSSWQSLRNNLFIPIAVLLLLPGAALAQVRAIVAQGSTILGEVNPFEGITRSIIAIFMIPASFLVVNYGIDLSNALTYGISNEYSKLFGTDMYQDAECAEMRAFPVNGTNQNMNALLPFKLPSIGGNDPWSSFEGAGIANKLFDPCVGLNQSLIPDEAASSLMNTNRMMMNGSNAFLAMTWNIMCAFQTVFLYYLWCMGPIVAALWVWPMERLRSALPSWIEGVITLCFWSLFWNVVVLLMACFRGVSETGTVIMTALNSLATISVWYAFDFSALISEGAGYSMMNSISQSIGQAAKGGGGAGPGGGGQKQASGGARQASGGGMGPGFMGGPGGAMANARGVPGNGMGGGAMGGSMAFGTGSAMGGSSPGGIGSGSMGAGLMAGNLGSSSGAALSGRPGLMPNDGRGGGSVLPTFSTASSGAQLASTNSNALNTNQNQQLNQSAINQKQLEQQKTQAGYMQALAQDQARQKQDATRLGEAQQVAAQQSNLQQTSAQAAMAMAMLGQQEAAKQMQPGVNSLRNPNADEQARLSSRLPSSGTDLPPTTNTNPGNLANAPNIPSTTSGVNLNEGILVSNAGMPPLSAPDISRSTLPPSIEPVTIAQTDGSFAAGSFASPPSIVDDSLPIYSYTTVDPNAPNEVPGTDPTYVTGRPEQTVDWSNATNEMSRESIYQQSAFVPSVNTQSQTQFVNQTPAEQQQQPVQYIPAEVRQERIEVQQVQQPAKQVQETIVQQQPKQPAQPTKPNVQKPVNTIIPILSSPPAPPKRGGISSLLANLQKSNKPDPNQSPSGGTLSRDSNSTEGQENTKTGSLADHLSRLNRGGGRTAPKAKDILSEAGLPPQTESEKDEEEKES